VEIKWKDPGISSCAGHDGSNLSSLFAAKIKMEWNDLIETWDERYHIIWKHKRKTADITNIIVEFIALLLWTLHLFIRSLQHYTLCSLLWRRNRDPLPPPLHGSLPFHNTLLDHLRSYHTYKIPNQMRVMVVFTPRLPNTTQPSNISP
jgi:hypothetical protein